MSLDIEKKLDVAVTASIEKELSLAATAILPVFPSLLSGMFNLLEGRIEAGIILLLITLILYLVTLYSCRRALAGATLHDIVKEPAITIAICATTLLLAVPLYRLLLR